MWENIVSLVQNIAHNEIWCSLLGWRIILWGVQRQHLFIKALSREQFLSSKGMRREICQEPMSVWISAVWARMVGSWLEANRKNKNNDYKLFLEKALFACADQSAYVIWLSTLWVQSPLLKMEPDGIPLLTGLCFSSFLKISSWAYLKRIKEKGNIRSLWLDIKIVLLSHRWYL